MEVRTPRGTTDLLPQQSRLWQRIEATAADVMRTYGFGEIRTPVFEHTELFVRGVGETSDIVEKQMYTFEDRAGRSVTLRPEGTAPVVRAFVQHKLYGQSLPQKLWYMQPMFRYERPQLGRGRQFHQFGAEVLGSTDPVCDVEVIAAADQFYRRLGFTDYTLLINNIGCPDCRPAYRARLLDFLRPRLEALCSTCRGRVDRNPLRVLDCKEDGCRRATEDAPAIDAFLCEPCRDHGEQVQQLLAATGIAYRVDPRLVRGLDYYTKVVFEMVTDVLGAQGTLIAGGRYDGLVEEIGGPAVPAVGFGAGMERAAAVLDAAGLAEASVEADVPDVFIVTMGALSRVEGVKLASMLRAEGIAAAVDYAETIPFDRSMRAQLRAADRSKAAVTIIIGEDELDRGVVQARVMATGEQTEWPRTDVATAVAQLLEEKITR